ncbi:putative ferric-chelate reductase 1 [Saccostrea cucullata]|uniref:putative ferric-chelate reductase 1 n=1 Tax=Saccostrea cuccullata TaxID=36930 RepID=UPI002ED26C9A
MACTDTYFYFAILLAILGRCDGRPDGVKGCGTLEASFVPIHGNSSQNNSLPIYIRADRNHSDWSVFIWTKETFFKGFYLRVFSVVDGETVSGNFHEMPPGTRACSSIDACHTTSTMNHTYLAFMWKPHSSFHGNVYFKASVVVSYTQGYKIMTTLKGGNSTTVTEKDQGTTILERFKECGSSIGCLSKCNSGSCSHLVTWKKRGDFVRFEFMADTEELNKDLYLSIGFSNDEWMGDDYVMACKVHQGDVTFELGTNVPSKKVYNPNIDVHVNSDDVIVLETSLIGSMFKCAVEQRILSKHPKLSRLDRKWYLLHAIGLVTENGLHYHSERSVSSEMVDFLSTSVVAEENPSRVLLKLHGSLMMLAWLFFAPVGIISSRLFRQSWGEWTICGQKVWFQIHRSCMLLVFIFTITAIVVIFADVKGFSYIDISVDYRNIHPILGIAATLLCILNLLISIFRCPPDDSKREIFNRIHGLFGLTSYLLAVLNIVVGAKLDRSMFPSEGNYMIYGCLAMLSILELVYQLKRLRQDFGNGTFSPNSKKTENNNTKKVHVMETGFYTLVTLTMASSVSFVIYLLLTS